MGEAYIRIYVSNGCPANIRPSWLSRLCAKILRRLMTPRNSNSETDERFDLYCNGRWLICFLAILQRPERVGNGHSMEQSLTP